MLYENTDIISNGKYHTVHLPNENVHVYFLDLQKMTIILSAR